ncbi:MAG: AAA family ATPase [Nitrososphaerota archaeon]
MGPIDNAEMDIGEITAVIGPNGSGKTFLSLIMLSISDMFAASPFVLPDLEMDEKLLNTINANLGTKTYTLKISDAVPMAERKYGQAFIAALQKNFGVPYPFLIKNGLASKTSIISIESETVEIMFGIRGQEIEYHLNIRNDFDVRVEQTETPPGTGSSCSSKDHTLFLRVASDMNAQQRVNLISYQILAMMTPEYFRYRNTEFLPTERGLIISIFNVLTSWYVNSYLSQSLAQQLGISKQEMARLQTDRASVGRFINDFLQNAAVQSRVQAKEYLLPFRNKHISFRILQPLRIEVADSQQPVPLGLLSSGYSQVIPLVFFQNSPNLIIEEPEINLHAGQQIEVANFLFSLKGNIFLTTHSDRFLVQIGINHKRSKRDVRIYLLDKGFTKEKHILENGDIENFETITEALNEQAKELSS